MINKGVYNVLRSKKYLIGFSKKNYLNNNISNTSSRMSPETKNFQVSQYYDILFFGLNSKKA